MCTHETSNLTLQLLKELVEDYLTECKEILKRARYVSSQDQVELLQRYDDCVLHVFRSKRIIEVEILCGLVRCLALVPSDLDIDLRRRLEEVSKRYSNVRRILIYELPCGNVYECVEEFSKLVFNNVIKSEEFVQFLHKHNIRVRYILHVPRDNNTASSINIVELGPIHSSTRAIIGIQYLSPLMHEFRNVIRLLNSNEVSDETFLHMVDQLVRTIEIYVGVHKVEKGELYKHPEEDRYFNLLRDFLEGLIRKDPVLSKFNVKIAKVRKFALRGSVCQDKPLIRPYSSLYDEPQLDRTV